MRKARSCARTPCAGCAPHPTGRANTIWSSSIRRTARAEALGAELSAALPAVLAAGALVVSESDRRAPLELTMPTTDERRYGDTLIRFHGP